MISSSLQLLLCPRIYEERDDKRPSPETKPSKVLFGNVQGGRPCLATRNTRIVEDDISLAAGSRYEWTPHILFIIDGEF